MIDSFTGKYYFLSNFFNLPVIYDGITYKNNEAAFQAQKATDYAIRRKFANYSPDTAKRMGRHINLREDWESVKDDIMYEICKCKFEQNPQHLRRLLDTGGEELIEGNSWGDTYWGVCEGVGRNQLGKTLMRVRAELSQNKPMTSVEEVKE